MKVFQLLETNEWANQEIDLPHLSKVQKARTHEFWVYLQYLIKKYPELSSSSSLSSKWLSSLSSKWSSSLSSKWLSSLSSLSLSLSSLSSLSSESDKEKYKIKYDRMIEAKKRYEQAGGDYENK